MKKYLMIAILCVIGQTALSQIEVVPDSAFEAASRVAAVQLYPKDQQKQDIVVADAVRSEQTSRYLKMMDDLVAMDPKKAEAIMVKYRVRITKPDGTTLGLKK